MSSQPDLFKAAKYRRDLAIDRVGARADRVVPSWTDEAARLIGEYAKWCAPLSFLIEDAVVWAHARGLPKEIEPRAWGAATQKAKRLKLIEACGFRQARTSNLAPKVLWRALSENTGDKS